MKFPNKSECKSEVLPLIDKYLMIMQNHQDFNLSMQRTKIHIEICNKIANYFDKNQSEIDHLLHPWSEWFTCNLTGEIGLKINGENNLNKLSPKLFELFIEQAIITYKHFND